MVEQINNLNHSKEILPLSNSNLEYSIVVNNIQNKNVGYSQKQKLPNMQSEPQNIPENDSKTNNMSIPEYSSHSIITLSSKNSSTLFTTKINTANKYKTNNRFDTDSSFKISIPNNMRRTKTSKINNTLYYTLNDITESDSITSK